MFIWIVCNLFGWVAQFILSKVTLSEFKEGEFTARAHHGSLWELKGLYRRETLKHEEKSLSLDGIFIMHSFQERFVYSSLRKMGSCQPLLGWKSYSVVVQFYPWFKFCFPLFYPKQRKGKFKPRIGLNHNIYIWYWNVSCNVRQNMRRILSW